jgi:anthranilate 1,2-dioxygenase small subunit
MEISISGQAFSPKTLISHHYIREDHDQGVPIGILRCTGRGMLVDCVKAFHTANIFQPQCYNHLLGHCGG